MPETGFMPCFSESSREYQAWIVTERQENPWTQQLDNTVLHFQVSPVSCCDHA